MAFGAYGLDDSGHGVDEVFADMGKVVYLESQVW